MHARSEVYNSSDSILLHSRIYYHQKLNLQEVDGGNYFSSHYCYVAISYEVMAVE